MSIIRRQFNGGAASTTLAGGINTTDAAFSIADATGWPDGSVGPFYVAVNRGQSNEEKVLCLSRSATNVTVVTSPSTGRGADGTVAKTHAIGETVEVIGTARDLDEANKVAVEILARMAAKGDLVLGAGVETGVKLSVGADGFALFAAAAQASGAQWRAITEADVTNLLTDLAAKVSKSTFAAKGDLLTATGAAAPVVMTVGADAQVLTADSAQATGLKWATPANGAPLAVVSYSSGGSSGISIPLTTSADLDATNLKVTFTAPASGAVTVELEGVLDITALGSGSQVAVHYTLRSGASDVAGTDRVVLDYSPGATGPTLRTRPSTSFYITGLTPGTSYTYKWGGYYTKAGTVSVVGLAHGTSWGPLMMTVRPA